jgi:hypothetical protein
MDTVSYRAADLFLVFICTFLKRDRIPLTILFQPFGRLRMRSHTRLIIHDASLPSDNGFGLVGAAPVSEAMAFVARVARRPVGEVPFLAA